MKGTSGRNAFAIAKASGALNSGIAWSLVIKSHSCRASAARIAAGVSTASATTE